MYDLETLRAWTRQTSTTIARAEGQLDQLEDSVGQVKQLLENAKALTEALGVVGAYLTTFGEQAQKDTQAKIEALVTHGLVTIFNEQWMFRLVPGTRGNVATMSFQLVSHADGNEVATDVMDARGGGVAAVIGFLLRLVVLLLTPNASKLMVLDESFAQVSDEYEQRVGEFIRELVDKTGVQILLITHSHAYTDMADRAYRFRLQDGLTKVEALHA